MPLPLAIPLAMAALPAIYQMGMGMSQNAKSNRMRPERPDYQVPGAINEMVASARQAAGSQRMPGQGYEEDNVRANAASAMRSAAMAGGPNYLAAVAGINANTNRAFGQIGARSEAWRDQNRRMLMNTLSGLGRYQDQAWQWNQQQKFQEDAAAKSALKQAGQSNIYGGIAGISAAGTMMMGRTGSPAGMPGVAAGASGSVTPSVMPIRGNYSSGGNYGLRGMGGVYGGPVDPMTGEPFY